MDDRELRNLKEFYSRDGPRIPAGKMRGEMAEVIRLAVKYGATMGFSLNLNRRELWGIPLEFNDFTGRITVQIGKVGKSAYVRNFLIRHVKEFQFSMELYEEYRKLNQ